MRGHFAKRAYTDKKTGQVKKASTWSVWYDERREGDGRKQKIKGGFRTRKEAESWFNRKAEELRQGIAPRDERLTIEKYLAQWLAFLESPGSKVRGAALHAYRNHVNLHIVPAIGKVGLSDLRPEHIEKAKAIWSGTIRKGRQKRRISPRTVRHIYGTLNAALNRAKRQRLIASNPCELTDAPSVERNEMRSLDASSGAVLLRAFEGTLIDAAVVTALGSGLRRGEHCLRCAGATSTFQRGRSRSNGQSSMSMALRDSRNRRRRDAADNKPPWFRYGAVAPAPHGTGQTIPARRYGAPNA